MKFFQKGKLLKSSGKYSFQAREGHVNNVSLNQRSYLIVINVISNQATSTL
jgi:hypothetical protein